MSDFNDPVEQATAAPGERRFAKNTLTVEVNFDVTGTIADLRRMAAAMNDAAEKLQAIADA